MELPGKTYYNLDIMKNNELFVLNPLENNLLNDGVVNINNAEDENGLKIIRHELKTFVCEGEYERGIQRILDTYLKHVEDPKQPAVWVSGFFGSGKSHLIKMLKYYWEDFKFPNGDTARTIKELPFTVKEKLTELDRKQKIHGKLAISGTLKDFPSRDIRYSFLQLMLDSLGLPQQYHLFKFVHWAKEEGIYKELVSHVENQGKDFDQELERLFVSPLIAKAVLELKPDFAESEAKVREAFKAQFQRVESINRNQLFSTIKNEVLPMFFGDKIPCTVIVLDEVQQFIGQDQSKTIDIQNLAQDVCDNFDGKFLLIGSGQNALAETPQLSPLQDRFSVKVALSDTDVETVTRKTVLEKKATAVSDLEKKLENNLGEISRNLSGTAFGYKTEDHDMLVADYPILPSTRKFWKKMFQIIDKAGTSGQLRSQLRIVDESLKLVAKDKVGKVVPSDFIFEQKQQQFLQNAILLNETNNLIEEKKAKGGDGELEGRVISVVFLLDQLPSDLPGGSLTSNVETIADLLISDLNEPSDSFRTKIKGIIENLAEEKILMPVDDEYKLQTKVGAEWEKEFTSQRIKLQNDGEDIINRFRQEAFFNRIDAKTKGINILHGNSKQKREFEIWDGQERPDTTHKLHLWVRDGWNESEKLVEEEIRSEGTDAPLSYIFIPKERDQDLRSNIITYIAAGKTLERMGIPSSPEGEQAMKSMQTRKKSATNSVQNITEKIINEAKVYLAGGSLIDSGHLKENIKEALTSLADRQFFEFKGKADYPGWDRALRQGISRNPDALNSIQFKGEPKDHPVAIEILRFMENSTKSGREIRRHFMKAPYGWSQDAIDAILVMLNLTDIISSTEQDLKTSTINSSEFKREIHTITASDKLKIRKLFQEAGLACKPGDEFRTSEEYLSKLKELANSVSGEAPLPEPISASVISDILMLDGNERLLKIVQEEADLREKYEKWTEMYHTTQKRLPNWEIVSTLYEFLPDIEVKLKEEVDAIRDNRLLLKEPDPVSPILQRMVDTLNESLSDLMKIYLEKYEELMEELQNSEYFDKLSPEQKREILLSNQLIHKYEVKRLEAQSLANHLRKISLDDWKTKISALDSQFQQAKEEAVNLSSPKSEFYTLPKRTLDSEEEISAYVEEIKKDLTEIIKKSGSVILK